MKCVNIKLLDILGCFQYILNAPRTYLFIFQSVFNSKRCHNNSHWYFNGGPCQTSDTRFVTDISAFSVGVPSRTSAYMRVMYISQLRLCPAKHTSWHAHHRRLGSASASLFRDIGKQCRSRSEAA